MSKEAMKSEMVDDEGENQAVRMFLALYGGQHSVTTKQMRKHLEMAGFDGAWPEWANSETHLTKAGAQLWIRHLFALAAPVQQEPVDIAALVEGMEVSIDVSTGDHDSGNRLFGTVTVAQENQGSKHGLILLVQDPEANFKTAAPQPAQRTWVGLTDEEIEDCYGGEVNDFARAIEAKLKEKNT